MFCSITLWNRSLLFVVCDLTIASGNAKFGQTGPKVGSFDAGYGAGYLARIIGHKKAREIWYLCRQYSAKEALEMGLVNTVVPFEQLEEETVKWAKEILVNIKVGRVGGLYYVKQMIDLCRRHNIYY